MQEDKARQARPIYQCTICGRALPWDGGRIRLVCGEVDCHGERPRPTAIKVRECDADDRDAMLAASLRFFGSEHLHTFGRVFSLAEIPCLTLEFGGERAGYLSYVLDFPQPEEATMVMLVVKPRFQGRGVGKALQGAMDAICRPQGIKRIHVATSNDNIPGLYFYQRLGYHIEGVSLGAAAEALREHGETKMNGFGGIPISDEIRLVKELHRVAEKA